MGDELAVMNDGVLQQMGTPEATYDRPDNRFVASFLGSPAMNFLAVDVARREGRTVCELDGTRLVALPDGVESIDRSVQLGIRPEDLELAVDPDPSTRTGTVRHVEYQGNDNFVQLEFAGRTLTCVVPSVVRVERGDSVGINFPPANVHLFDMDTGDAVRSPPGGSGDNREGSRPSDDAGDDSPSQRADR